MDQLSKDFRLAEFCDSHIARQEGIANSPGDMEIKALKALCDNVLQPLRDHYGRPVQITSGYRSAALNKRVGGAANSQHRFGEAADIRIPGIRNASIWQFIRQNLQFDQVIAERLSAKDGMIGWIHVSYREGANRFETLSSPRPGQYVTGLAYV